MDKARVGVIGLRMGMAHLRGYEECPRARVTALCDINEEALNAALEGRADVQGFTDYRKMLESAELDAVSVALPNHLHAPVTLAAIEAGKHVLCEKPMALNAAEAQQMKEAADRAGKVLMMHFNMRFMTVAATLRPLVEAGTLGHIYHAVTTYTRRDGYPRPGTWFGQKELSGGGPLIDLGVHRLDLALWLMGYPRPVAAFGNCYDLLARQKLEGVEFDCEDFAAAMVRFDNGSTLYLAASWDGHQAERTEQIMRLYGTRGSVFERNGQMTLCRQENGLPATRDLEPREPEETPQAHFVACILDGRAPGPSAAHGVSVMKILDAVYESSRTGREVAIR